MTPSRRTRNSPHRQGMSAALAAVALTASLAAGPATAAAAPPDRLDNPYADAQVYVNPEWAAHAAAEPGGEAVAGQPTAVWLESIADIEGSAGSMGLRDHLDAALAQDADLVQLVLRNLPGRDCDRLFSGGELTPDQQDRYEHEFIDPVTGILADPAYAGLRVVVVVEPYALASLVTHTSPRQLATPLCNEMRDNGGYVAGIGYALSRLGDIDQVYSYLDAGHHGTLGWPDNRLPAGRLMLAAASTSGATPQDVHGFAVNTANYSVLREEHFAITDVVAGVPVRQSRWVDWNESVDEALFAETLRGELTGLGFAPDIGAIIDTSRNGWGGPDRPTGPAPTTDVNRYVEESRLDRRLLISNWCNQAGSGLGERPTAAPATGIDAYAWIKPPGESDGAHDPLLPWADDPMCDPDYLPPPYWRTPTGALPDAPAAGEWFPAHFQELMRNAWPPL